MAHFMAHASDGLKMEAFLHVQKYFDLSLFLKQMNAEK